MPMAEAFAGWERAKLRLAGDPLVFGRRAFDAIRSGTFPAVASLAFSLGWPEARARLAAGALDVAGLLAWDPPAGRVVGALGLTLERTPYRLDLDGRRLYVWCALDAVGIPAALGADAGITAPMGDAAEAIRISIRGGELAGVSRTDVRIAVPSPDAEARIVDDVCPEIRFWPAVAAPRHPAVAVLTIDEAMRLGRVIWS